MNHFLLACAFFLAPFSGHAGSDDTAKLAYPHLSSLVIGFGFSSAFGKLPYTYALGIEVRFTPHWSAAAMLFSAKNKMSDYYGYSVSQPGFLTTIAGLAGTYRRPLTRQMDIGASVLGGCLNSDLKDLSVQTNRSIIRSRNNTPDKAVSFF